MVQAAAGCYNVAVILAELNQLTRRSKTVERFPVDTTEG